jgi:DNA-binding transcriptional LysR family regulator
MSRMDLRHIRYFVAVAEEAHFSRAAKRLHIVQPALSMQIRALETDLGVTLFERTSRRVELTEAGALFRIEAERTLQQAARAKDVAQRAARGEVGSVRIGFVASAMFAGKVPADLRSFKLRYPAVDIELAESLPVLQTKAVLSGQLDAGYAGYHSEFRNIQEPELAVDRIASWKWMIAMTTDHKLAARRALPANALRDEAFIVYASLAGVDGQVRVLRQILGKEPRILHTAPTILALLSFAASGFGLALVPSPFQNMAIPNIAYRPLANFSGRAELVMVSRRNERSPAVRRFIEIARASELASGSNLSSPSLKRR